MIGTDKEKISTSNGDKRDKAIKGGVWKLIENSHSWLSGIADRNVRHELPAKTIAEERTESEPIEAITKAKIATLAGHLKVITMLLYNFTLRLGRYCVGQWNSCRRPA